jgi:hypothetical protein
MFFGGRMRECICNSCVNLEGVIDENGAVSTYECIYGYPSEKCDTCETGECELMCSHYVEDTGADDPVIVHCSVCGRELSQHYNNDDEGEIKCIECFLKDSM